MSIKCKECFNIYEKCEENKHGLYLVKAVKRHYKNNIGNTTSKDVHDIYTLMYNVIIDHSMFKKNHEMLENLNILPPMCMRSSSLLFCLKWTKWRNNQLKDP